MRRALILNSRQSLYPHGDQLWVSQTRRAVKSLSRAGYGLLAATTAPTWELQLFLAAESRNPICLVVANGQESPEKRMKQEFGLSITPDQIFRFNADGDTDDTQSIQMHRFLIDQADRVFPVSIRAGGILQKLLDEYPAQDKIDRRFSVAYSGQRATPRYDFSDNSPNLPFDPSRYLFHWTRTARLGWPKMAREEYYRAIVQSKVYPFSAIATLGQILHERLLRATNRHMIRNLQVVSFTGESPHAMKDRMRWRRRYREMSFEPYGIGIERSWAERAGITAVQYVIPQGSRSRVKSLEESSWLRQGQGRNANWVAENEYRVRGDQILPAGSPELVSMTYTATEAARISSRFGILCGSFQDT